MGILFTHYLGTIIFMGIITALAMVLLFYVVLAKCCSCCAKRKAPPKQISIVSKLIVTIFLVLSTIVMICGITALYHGQNTVKRSTQIFAASGASILIDGGKLVNTIQPTIDQALDYSIEEFGEIVGDLSGTIDEILTSMNGSVSQIVVQLGIFNLL
jgi:predicted PurR-regulated permease PerM